MTDEVEKQEEEQVETPVEETQEEAKQEEVQQDEKPKKTAQDRIQEIKKATWEKHEAQRRLDAREAEIAAREQKLREAEEKSLVEPDIEKFDDHAQYLEENRRYNERKIAIEADKRAQANMQRYQKQQQDDQMQREWSHKRMVAQEKDPNFVVHENKVDLTFKTYQTHPVVIEAIMSDPNATDVVTFLGNNQEELDRLASLPPQGALMELGKLNYKLGTKPKPTLTKAPDPVDGVGGSDRAPRDLANASQTDYEAEMNRKQFGY